MVIRSSGFGGQAPSLALFLMERCWQGMVVRLGSVRPNALGAQVSVHGSGPPERASGRAGGRAGSLGRRPTVLESGC